MPADLLVSLAGAPKPEDMEMLPGDVVSWLQSELDVDVTGKQVEWSPVDVYIGLPRPGGDGWLSIDLNSGEVIHEVTSRGFVSYLNDLHKGRNTGTAWAWFIDVFSVACVIFCLTGLWLLQIHAGKRPATWPVVGAGFVLPLLLIVLFIH